MKLISEELKKEQNEKDEAIRYDFGKNRVDLLPYDAIEKVTEVFTHGAIKYNDENWRKGMSWKRIYGSLFRHLFKSFRGEDIDKDSGCLHLAMAAWGCLVLIHYLQEGLGTDDRVVDSNIDNLYTCYLDTEKQEKLFKEINTKLLNKKINKTEPIIKVTDITNKDDVELMDNILEKVTIDELGFLVKSIVKDTITQIKEN